MNVNSDEDAKSFKDLYNKYYDPLFNYIFHRVSDKQNAEDIISNTFFNAFDFIKKKDPKIDNFHAWIFKIATNELFKFINKEKKQKKSMDLINEMSDFVDKSTENTPEEYCDFVILRNEIEKIKEPGKSILVLHFFEKKTYAEISEILNIKENTLRSTMSRIMKVLYVKLKNKF
jgi:RNA polymerase sigma-70 factor (ECF subfamily)